MPYEKLKKAPAELWISTKEKGFLKMDATISIEGNNIGCQLKGVLPKDVTPVGAIILQGGKIAAVVSEYDEELRFCKCISAETVAFELLQTERKEKILQALSETK